MADVARQHGSTIDGATLVEASRSPFFEDGFIRSPLACAQGEVTVDVTLPRGSTALSVPAPSHQDTYGILHKLASTKLEIEYRRQTSLEMALVADPPVQGR